MDVDKLLKALDKEENEELIDTTSEKIAEERNAVIHDLDLDTETEKKILSRLNDYKYVDSIDMLHAGAYIRWIDLKDPDNIVLRKGALLCEVKFTDAGTVVVCKNFYHRHFQVLFDECLVFQRLSDQERVLLSAIDYLSK